MFRSDEYHFSRPHSPKYEIIAYISQNIDFGAFRQDKGTFSNFFIAYDTINQNTYSDRKFQKNMFNIGDNQGGHSFLPTLYTHLCTYAHLSTFLL